MFDQRRTSPNGRYRVIVSRFAPGRPLGNFRYYGTRPDDPNDIVPHEHRRELRGARVFGAWLNHDDSRGINSLDMLETANGKASVKHYMFDFGSILGSGDRLRAAASRRQRVHLRAEAGMADAGDARACTCARGCASTIRTCRASIGRFEADAFDPLAWKPEYPNPAFDNMRPDDAFWAARIVSRFTDEMIRGDRREGAVLRSARHRLHDAGAHHAARQGGGDLAQRCARSIDPSLAARGTLTFANAAVDAASPPRQRSYTLQWFRFDNATDTRTPMGDPASVRGLSAQAPAGLLASGNFVGVTISARHAMHAGWARPATFFFRAGIGRVGSRRRGTLKRPVLRHLRRVPHLAHL